MAQKSLAILKDMVLLIAEDDPVAQLSLKKILTPLFRNVFVASDGMKALELFYQHLPHIAILDISMPRMDGMEVAQRIREHDADLPVIIITALAESEHILSAVRLRLMDYIFKPFTLNTLHESLAKCVEEMVQRGKILTHIHGDIYYNNLTQKLLSNDQEVSLTRNENCFLLFMLKHRKQVVHSELLCSHITPDEGLSISGLRNLVYRLRSKVGKDAIVSVRDTGYMMQ